MSEAPTDGTRGPGPRPFRLKTLEGLLQIAVSVAVLVGGVTGYIQYQLARTEKRVERTLAQIQRFDGADYDAAQNDMANLSDKLGRAIRELSDQPDFVRLLEKQRERLEKDVHLRVVYGESAQTGSPALPLSVAKVVGFFDELSICVERHLCDGPTAHAYFDGYASTLWENFRPIILEERERGRPQFGAQLEVFVHGHSSAQ